MSILQRYTWVILSAALAVCVFPPVGWWWLSVVAWVPLLVGLRGWKARPAFYAGLSHGLLFFGITLSWMWNIFGPTAIALWLMLAFFTALFASFYAVLDQNRWWSLLAVPILWTGIEHYRSEWFKLDFPWMTPGLGLGPMWLSSLLGVYGISFLILLASALLLQESSKSRMIGLVTIVGVLAGVGMKSKVEVGSDALTVVSAQSESMVDTVYRYLSETELEKGRSDFVLWPENALVSTDLQTDEEALKDLQQWCLEHDTTLITGSRTEKATHWYNTATTLDSGGVLGQHYKNHPVHLFDDGKAGVDAVPINTTHGKVGTPICFDCDYEDVVRRMTSSGAEFFLIPSLDAESWSRRQHHQHSELFRHRAAENGRWMVVCATSGKTQLIDPNGNRRQELPMYEEGAMRSTFSRESKLTVYTRFGWLFGPACVVLAVLIMLAKLLTFYGKRRHQAQADQWLERLGKSS